MGYILIVFGFAMILFYGRRLFAISNAPTNCQNPVGVFWLIFGIFVLGPGLVIFGWIVASGK